MGQHGKVNTNKRKLEKAKKDKIYETKRRELRSLLVDKSDSVLYKEAEEVPSKEKAQELYTLLRKVVRATDNGVGLAAPQIGISLRAFVVRPYPNLTNEIMFMANPKITPIGEEKNTDVEGCLSFPEIFVKIERFSKIKVEYLDENMNSKSRIVDRVFEARIIQHENDHILGKNIISYETNETRLKLPDKKGEKKRVIKQLSTV